MKIYKTKIELAAVITCDETVQESVSELPGLAIDCLSTFYTSGIILKGWKIESFSNYEIAKLLEKK